MSWNQDAFGNRLAQTQGGSPAVAVPTSSSASYNANNQLLSSSLNLGSALVYDAAGDVTNDGTNLYLYEGVPVGRSTPTGRDVEGRICAVNSTNNLASSYRGLTGYVYDAAGIRVAKGSLTRFTCDFNPANSTTYNGFAANTSWVLGQGREQVGEWKLIGSTWTWQHSNVSAGKLLGTYDTKGLHFYFNDWLGSRRVQTNALGQLEQRCRSLPYGNGETCTLTALSTADDPTEQHFTGKERDSESGNDHFGARYYASSMGRFMSPDPVKITATRLLDPQGLNLYSYARNHPLISIDRDGNMTVVVVVQNRAASLSLYSDQGVKISDYQGLARGSRGPNRMIERGDTPFGRYLFTGTEGGTSQSRLGTGYGTGKVRFNPDAGEAIESVRTDIRIHGGGTSATLVPDPYAGNQNLIATWGCVRLTNNDVNSLIGDIHSLQTKNGEQNVGDSIYVGDSNYLRFMSGQTNSDGASLYPDLSSVMNPLSSMGIDTSFTPPTQNTQQNTQTDTLQHEENH